MKWSVDEGYRLIAVRYIRKQLNILSRNLKGIPRYDDIEYVHQARVASRRLRSGLRMFEECFSKKKVENWRQSIKKLTRSLGEARDKDVQIEFVKKAQNRFVSSKDRPGINRLLLRLQQRRDVLQPEVEKTVVKINESRLFDEMYASMGQQLFSLKRHKVVTKSRFAYKRAYKHIQERMTELLLLQDCLDDSLDIERHHTMRIAAKRLRYTLEICRYVYGNVLDPAIAHIKQVQTLLGDIHDCDVWKEFLNDFIEEERLRTLEYFGHERSFTRLKIGIETLQLDQHAARQQQFKELVAFWRSLEDERFWQELTRTLEAPLIERVEESVKHEPQEVKESPAESPLPQEEEVRTESGPLRILAHPDAPPPSANQKTLAGFSPKNTA